MSACICSCVGQCKPARLVECAWTLKKSILMDLCVGFYFAGMLETVMHTVL